MSLFSIWTHKNIWNVYWINVRDLNVRYITEIYIRNNVVSGFYSYIVTSFESINNGTSRKTELKNFYFSYQPPDLIEQRGKTALININQILVSICVIIPNKYVYQPLKPISRYVHERHSGSALVNQWHQFKIRKYTLPLGNEHLTIFFMFFSHLCLMNDGEIGKYSTLHVKLSKKLYGCH